MMMVIIGSYILYTVLCVWEWGNLNGPPSNSDSTIGYYNKYIYIYRYTVKAGQI